MVALHFVEFIDATDSFVAKYEGSCIDDSISLNRSRESSRTSPSAAHIHASGGHLRDEAQQLRFA